MRATRHAAAVALGLGIALATTAPALGVGMGKAQIALGQNGEREAITPLTLADNVTGYQLDAGKRLVCLRVKVRNAGEATFTEFVGNGAKLRLRGGVNESPRIAGGGLCQSTGTIKLKRNASTSLNLPFILNKTARVVGFEYVASSGYGTNKPVWGF
jgi:hypothetical protein